MIERLGHRVSRRLQLQYKKQVRVWVAHHVADVSLALRLLALAFVHTNELIGSQREEFDLNSRISR